MIKIITICAMNQVSVLSKCTSVVVLGGKQLIRGDDKVASSIPSFKYNNHNYKKYFSCLKRDTNYQF